MPLIVGYTRIAKQTTQEVQTKRAIVQAGPTKRIELHCRMFTLSAKGAHLISVSRYLPQGKCLVHSEQSSLIVALAYQYWQGQTLREFFLKLQLENLEGTSEIKICVFY